MNKKTLEELTGRYLDGTATDAERRMLDAYYEKMGATPVESETVPSDRMLAAILEQTGLRRERPRLVWLRRAAAAAAVVLVAGGTWFFLQREQHPGDHTIVANIPPAADRAVLTLANGDTLVLDESVARTIGKQGGANVARQADALVYQGEGEAAAPVFNTLRTPRGGKYRLTLSDGTTVWLNAASSIRFPAQFDNRERRVRITGEAYFDVAQNASAPFIVEVDDRADIRVLGTQFNVNAYTDEPTIITTLVSGKVQCLSGSSSTTLVPAQRAVIAGGRIDVQLADVEASTGWKDGYFRFREADIKTIMRQVSRWYNVDVQYEADIRHLFVADIPRDAPLPEILKLLTLTDRVHFEVKGSVVTVKQ
ncbi:FecR family protein [Chitinophaga lutea]